MSDAAAPTSEQSLKGEITVLELDRVERSITRRSAESRATVPTLELTAHVDAGALARRIDQSGCSLVAAVTAACAQALRRLPRVNAAYRDGRYELYSRVNVGVTLIADAVYTTPTIFDADARSVAEIGSELDAYRARAQAGELHPADIAGATFTVLDFSPYAVAVTSPIVLQSQAAALAFGPLREEAVARGGELVSGHTLQLFLSADHRIVYGHHAATFLEEVKAILEEAQP